MNSFTNSVKYFITITAELTVLFLGISTMVALLLMYMPQEKIKNWMSTKGIWGNFIGAFIGALTPFCACSTIPLTLGFIEAGITFGAIMSFVISSPLLNPIILAMLVALMGWQACVTYFIVVFGGAVVFGVILEKTGGAKLVKNVRIKSGGHQNAEELPKIFICKLKYAFLKAWGDFKAVLIYLIIGVGIGIGFHHIQGRQFFFTGLYPVIAVKARIKVDSRLIELPDGFLRVRLGQILFTATLV